VLDLYSGDTKHSDLFKLLQKENKKDTKSC